jgi:exonuclease SbcC
MRPLSLRFTAFGSYPGTEEVDFRRLAEHGLFLVTGPTGAGKTTVFDAMVYALYGALPGDRPEAEVRSHHAPADRPTSVELTFEVDGGCFRIRRTAAWDAPKLRGAGVTARPATAELHRLHPDGAEEPVAAKVGECTARCNELVGLDATKFQQVVLLPQGRFTAFLLANSTDRAPLLRQLFGGARYERATRHLTDVAKQRRAEVADADQQIAHHLANARAETAELRSLGAEGRETEPHETEQPDRHDQAETESLGLDELTAVITGQRVRQQAARRELGDLTTRAEADAEALRVVAARQARFDQRTTLRRRAAELEHEAAGRAEDAARVERSERLRPVVASLDARDEAERRLGLADETLAERLGRVADEACVALPDLDLRDPAAVAVAVLGPAAVRGRAEIDRGLALLEAVTRATDEATQALEARAGAEAARARTAGEHEEAEVSLRTAEDERDRTDALARELHRREAAATAAGDAVDRRRELEECAGALAGAVVREAEAGRRAADRRAAYHTGSAARLAAELHDGEPCPVCGSEVHPTPAAADPTAPTVTVASVDEAASLHQATVVEVATLTARVATLRDQLGPLADRDPGELETEREAARHAHAEAAAAAARLGALQQRCTDLADAVRAAAKALALAEAAVSHAEAEVVRTERAVAVATEAAAGLEPERLALAGQALDRLDALLVELPELEQAVTAARATCNDARDRATEALATAGIDDEQAARAGVLPADEETRLRAELATWREERVRVGAQLEVLDAEDLPDERPDTATAEEAARRSRAAVDELQDLVARRESALVHAEQAVADARDAIEESAELRERAARCSEVAAVCEGRTARKISLETWVLAAELERVVEQANVHLGRMTGYRYTLRRVDDAKGNAKAGLDLVVHDAHTGRERPTRTLSGGEQFQASLALALGLADVVSHGGTGSGHRFEALFVDEGFGSLDPQALDEAVAALQQIQASGRIVGAITHVEAMKQQLPVGIEVRRLADGAGSTLVVR